MAFTIEDGAGTEIPYLWSPAPRFTNSINQQNTASFAEQEASPSLAIGEDVFFKDDSDNTIWGGTVQHIRERDWTVGETTHRLFEYDCVDFDELATRRIVANSYTGQTVKAIAQDIISSTLTNEGVTEGSIDTGPTVSNTIFFNYQSASRCLDELATLAGFGWRINNDKELDLRARSSVLAPFNITDASRPYQSLEIETRRTDYRNTQFIVAGEDLSDSRTETFTGDGERKTFNLSLKAGAVPTITLDTGSGPVAQTVGIRQVDTGDDWYWSKNEKEISQDDGGTAISNTDTLSVTYQGLFPIVIKASDGAEIASRGTAESRSGIYENVLSDPSINDQDLAFSKANSILEKYGEIPKVVTYTTDTYIDAGQLQSINLTSHGLSGDWLIEKVAATALESRGIEYSVTALSGNFLGGWVEYFKGLKRSGQLFVERENEVLVILASISEGVSFADAVTTLTDEPSLAEWGAGVKRILFEDGDVMLFEDGDAMLFEDSGGQWGSSEWQ